MKSKVFSWSSDFQGTSLTLTLSSLKGFCDTVEVLYITQGSIGSNRYAYTVFYKEKVTL